MAASIGEFAGCLYERPTPDGGSRDWRVDETTGSRFPYDLTRSEIAGMRLSGVPIKIEHAVGKAFAKGDEVGTVIDAATDPVTGYTACKFALHDTVSGRTIARLIRGGVLNSLSLGHEYDTSTGDVDAREVSVCFNGAREGTRLFKETSDFDRFKQKVVASGRRAALVSIAASLATTSPPIPVVMDTSVATGATAPTPVVPAATQQQQQQQQRHPAADVPADPITQALSAGATPSQVGAEVADGSAAPVDDAAPSMDLPDLLEKVTANADETLATELYKQIAGLAEKMRAGEKTNADLTSEKEKLVAKIKDTEIKNKKEASNVVATMNALLEEFSCGQSINCGLEQNQAQEAVFAAVPVLASAIHAQKNRATENNFETMRAGLATEIRNALRGPSPWKDDIAGGAPPVVPSVAVNASVRTAGLTELAADPLESGRPAQRRRFDTGLTPGQQAILSNLGSFGDAGRLTPDMMPTGYKGAKM